jgi:hypothetical protein
VSGEEGRHVCGHHSAPVPGRCRFWLGTHCPEWLERSDVPLFISFGRIARVRRKRLAPVRARGPYAWDSRGFTELSTHGAWTITPQEYADGVRWSQDAMGHPEWAAIQDWMCEPFITAKTGLTVAEHQKLTIASYLELRDLAPEVPWVPILQGWHFDDYLAHVEQWELALGRPLAEEPLVGLGSVCRRQHTGMVEELIRHLHGGGLRLHGFGFKVLGLQRVAPYLASADSMAWSTRARKGQIRLPGCPHRTCANCLRWALQWREEALAIIATVASDPQPLLPMFPCNDLFGSSSRSPCYTCNRPSSLRIPSGKRSCPTPPPCIPALPPASRFSASMAGPSL